eukprot:TRINITY_DN3762_c0_g1_i1.p2 TRINITY_DN3762_c0_g1~~TRINITY_DN3762_c0_g1_i1.p2  ORF type:complete len:57 (+),score=14.02 TRINITY_DN3762_c0_g1_i1:336-506(+)
MFYFCHISLILCCYFYVLSYLLYFFMCTLINFLYDTKKKKYRLRGRSSETAKAHRG